MKLEDRLDWKKDEFGNEVTEYNGFKFTRDSDGCYDVELEQNPCAFCNATPEKALEELFNNLDVVMCKIREIFAEDNETGEQEKTDE